MSNDNELLLLDFWPSFFCKRVKIALEEKGITDYDCLEVDPYNVTSSVLNDLNPVHKKLPVLVHHGRPICESLVIVEYIDEVWNVSPCLLPSDPYEKARARFWGNYIDSKFVSAGCKLSRAQDEAELDKKEFIQCLKLLESELGDKPYFGGNTFGYVDIALIPDYSWFYTYETCAKFSIEAECPKLIAWAKRCMLRDSVKKYLPDPLQVYNYVLKRNKKLGI